MGTADLGDSGAAVAGHAAAVDDARAVAVQAFCSRLCHSMDVPMEWQLATHGRSGARVACATFRNVTLDAELATALSASWTAGGADPPRGTLFTLHAMQRAWGGPAAAHAELASDDGAWRLCVDVDDMPLPLRPKPSLWQLADEALEEERRGAGRMAW
jgi:hypothetical protein